MTPLACAGDSYEANMLRDWRTVRAQMPSYEANMLRDRRTIHVFLDPVLEPLLGRGLR